MKRLPFSPLLAMLLVTLLPSVASPQASPKQNTLHESVLPNVIIIGWDGVQRDHFWECYNRDLPECPNGLPSIRRLARGRIFDLTVTDGATSTKAGWVQILSGYDAEVTGISSNFEYQPLSEGYSILEKVEAAYGDDAIETVFVSGKGGHVGATCQGELDVQGKLEQSGQPWCLTKREIDLFVEAESPNIPSDESGSGALSAIKDHFLHRPDQALVALFHFAEPDPSGHRHGENSIEYSEALLEIDQWLGRIVSLIRAFGADDNTLLYVITDHGFDEGLRSHANAPFGILATNDPLVIRGGDRKDLAATLLDRFDIANEAQGDIPPINGHSLYAPPPFNCVPEGAAYLDYPGAPPCCPGLSLVSLSKVDLGTRAFEACIKASGGLDDLSGYCTACGDGQCGESESLCNCYQDCAGTLPPVIESESEVPAGITCPAGSIGNPILREEFESWPPAGWTVVNNGGDCVIQSNTTWDRPNNTGAQGDCMDADSDRCGEGTAMDTELRTPLFELPPSAQVLLQYQTAYLNYLGEDRAAVEISTDGGANWASVLEWNEDHFGPVTVDLDLTAFGGSPATALRWRYTAPGWHWYWEVDNVDVTACEPAPPSVVLTPESQESVGCGGDWVAHTLALWNRTGAPALFTLEYASQWPVSGPTEIYVDQDETVEFAVEVLVEAGEEDTATVTAQGNGYSASAEVHTMDREHWVDGPLMPTPRGDLAVIVAADGLFAIGGTADGVAPGNGENEYYDFPGDTWSDRAPMPVPMTLIEGAEIEGIIYIPGGYDGTAFVGTTLAYDTLQDSWTAVAPAPREVVGYGLVACNGKLYRVGGSEPGTLPRGERLGEVYDPLADTWSPLPPMLEGHLWPAAGCIEGRLYVAGGIGRQFLPTDVAEVYDLATDQWSDAAMSDLAQPIMAGADLVLGDRLYLVGGSTTEGGLATTLVYDPLEDAWSVGASLTEARFRGDGAVLQDRAVVLGGWEPIWTPQASSQVLRQCGPSLHVDRIEMKTRAIIPQYRTSALVRITDAEGLPAPGASVSVAWTLPDGSNVDQTAETNLNGWARYSVTSGLEGSYELCVSNVVLEGYFYDPSQNRETCETLQVP